MTAEIPHPKIPDEIPPNFKPLNIKINTKFNRFRNSWLFDMKVPSEEVQKILDDGYPFFKIGFEWNQPNGCIFIGGGGGLRFEFRDNGVYDNWKQELLSPEQAIYFMNASNHLLCVENTLKMEKIKHKDFDEVNK